jgi:energy-coupling factor transporter ATP-binding protein EcfA2
MKTAEQPKSVFEMILTWSAGRPDWQRDALRRIIAKGALDATDIGEMVLLCKKGHGAPDIEVSAVPLAAEHVPALATEIDRITLTSITQISGVNRLASNQVLQFEQDGITIIYGDNGVGKSGYARILKRACRARFPGEILPDAFDPVATQVATATINYLVAGNPSRSAPWTDDGAVHPVLSAVSVFDRESGTVHVREKNEVAFRPFGLDIPDELAAVCQSVKEVLTAEQTALTNAQDPVFKTPTFSAATSVGKFLGSLTASTDLQPLKALAEVACEELARLLRLNEDLARDPLKASAEQRVLSASLLRFADDVAAVLNRIADAPLSHLLALAGEARDKRAAVTLAAELAFCGAAIRGVGELSWRALLDAARRYSEGVAFPEQAFPQSGPDALCVLCHQPLSDDATTRMGVFDAFVKADTEQQAQEAEKALEKARQVLLSNPIHMSAFGLRSHIVISNPALAASILSSLAAARLRRAICLKTLEAGGDVDMPELPHSPVEAIRQLAVTTAAYADELAAAAVQEGRTRLEQERDELRDRAALVDLLPKAVAEVARLTTVARITTCLTETTTNAITKLGNDIADQVITPRVRDRFQEEIQKLAATRVRVDIVRSGGKYGSPQYQVRLFANGKAASGKARVHSVLSEGEQTCVALAAFMTELTTAAHHPTLVFDDPVSSLDHRWRRKVADRLVEEAAVRQIIVFTHDLIFLNDLQSLAIDRGINHGMVSLTHSTAGAGIVNMGLPWAGAGVKERVDNLEKEVRAAKMLYEAHDDQGYADSVSKIYSKLRSTWERALEDVAFCGVINRHRDYINTKELAKVTALTEDVVKVFKSAFKKCCDQTEAHDPSRGRNAAAPPPDEILKDVQDVRAWTDSLRERQKAVS